MSPSAIKLYATGLHASGLAGQDGECQLSRMIYIINISKQILRQHNNPLYFE